MEEILALLIQFVVEVVFQILVYLPFDFLPRSGEKRGEQSGCGWLMLYLVLGGVCGGLSLLVAPRLLLPSTGLRVANLFATPVAAATLSWAVAEWRRRRGAKIDPWSHFFFALCFALAFSGVRLAYGEH